MKAATYEAKAAAAESSSGSVSSSDEEAAEAKGTSEAAAGKPVPGSKICTASAKPDTARESRSEPSWDPETEAKSNLAKPGTYGKAAAMTTETPAKKSKSGPVFRHPPSGRVINGGPSG